MRKVIATSTSLRPTALGYGQVAPGLYPEVPRMEIRLEYRRNRIFTLGDLLRIAWGLFLATPLLLLGLALTLTAVLAPIGIPIMWLGGAIANRQIKKVVVHQVERML